MAGGLALQAIALAWFATASALAVLGCVLALTLLRGRSATALRAEPEPAAK
ncbi:hypothetical protein Misp02_32300 [Microtetraspora sp. NBRC 16547]|nr:hypothetical protein Misp02_32300 [Microtetraspora sp. NBRC 16547]